MFDLHAFSSNQLRTNPLFIRTPPRFLEYSVITSSNQFVQLKLKLFYFVRIIRNFTVIHVNHIGLDPFMPFPASSSVCILQAMKH